MGLALCDQASLAALTADVVKTGEIGCDAAAAPSRVR